MRCEEIQTLLDLHLDRELPEEIERRVARHLLRCPGCAYESHTLSQTRSMLRSAFPVIETSPTYRERAAARLLDRLADHLRPALEQETGRQWTLPFAHEE
jgi:anti-sigma factor RsiW